MQSITRSSGKDSAEEETLLPPGVIDESMLGSFFARMAEINKYQKSDFGFSPQLVWNARINLAIAFVTGLRSAQMVTLKKKNFSTDARGALVLNVPKIHDPKSRINGQKMVRIGVMDHPIYTPVLHNAD